MAHHDKSVNHNGSPRDLSARPIPFLVLWGAPLLLMLSLNFLDVSVRRAALIIAACFVWMGIGCLINARRCHRRHCFYASPVLLIGAVLTLLIGLRVVDLGGNDLMYVVFGTFAAVGLTFLPEKFSGKYRS